MLWYYRYRREGLGMIRIAIVDDEESDLLYIKNKISQHLGIRKISFEYSLYTSADTLLKSQETESFDVIFMDIDMPKITGMDAAAIINKINPKTLIVFVTNHDELVFKAFRYKAIGFIRKKKFDEEIEDILEIILAELKNMYHVIQLIEAGKIIKIDLFDVKYVKSCDHYVEFHMKGGYITVRKKLDDIQDCIEDYGFIRIHSRYLVSYRYIFSIEKTTVILNDDMQLPLSRSRIEYVKEKFQIFSRRL